MRTFCDSVNFVIRLCSEEVAKIQDLDKLTGPTLYELLFSDPDIKEVLYDENGLKCGIHYTLNSRANTIQKRKQIENWVKGYLS